MRSTREASSRARSSLARARWIGLHPSYPADGSTRMERDANVRLAYARACEVYDDMTDAARFVCERERESASKRYWARMGHAANAALVTFLEEYATRVDGGADAPGAYTQAVRNAAKSCAKVKGVIKSENDARSVKGIGPRLAELIGAFFILASSPTLSEYGEPVAPRGFGHIDVDNGVLASIAAASRFEKSSRKRVAEPTTDAHAEPEPDATAQNHSQEQAGPAPRAKKARATKMWVPGYRTAGFALLVTMHKLALQGREVLTKSQLEDEAEASGLSATGIKSRAPPGGPAQGGGRGTYFAYSGWSSFNKLKSVQNGYAEPMVHTWKASYAMQIRLSKTGTELAAKLHAAAEARGDCTCGLWRGNVGDSENTEDPETAGAAADDDDDLEVLDDNGIWTPVMSQQPPAPASRVTQAAAARPPVALTALVSPSRVEWTLPPLEPGEKYVDKYDTVLVVDTSEARLGEGQLGFFHDHGIKTIRTKLEAGDFAWVACPKGSAPGLHNAYVLDFLVERKEVSDLQASIIQNAEKGQRYARQKYRMKTYCGLKNLVYLIEGDLSQTSNVGRMFRRGDGGQVRTFQGTHTGMSQTDMRKRLVSARVQTELFDGFKVVNTASFEDTKRLLKNLTIALHATYGPLTRAKATKSARTYAQYNREFAAALAQEHSVKITWMSMLAQIDGVGPEKAAAIVEHFPTPHALKRLCDQGSSRARVVLQSIPTSSRSVGPVASAKILEAFFPNC